MSQLPSPSPWTDRQDYLREHPPLSHFAALARIAELEAALEDTEAALQPFVDPVESARGTALHRIATDALLKAAAVLRNRI